MERAQESDVTSITGFHELWFPCFEALAMARKRLNLPSAKIDYPQMKKTCGLIARWLEQFKKGRQRYYTVSDVDIEATKRFIQGNPDLDIKIDSVLESAMSGVMFRTKNPSAGQGEWDKYFYCRKGGTLDGFLKYYEKILGELRL